MECDFGHRGTNLVFNTLKKACNCACGVFFWVYREKVVSKMYEIKADILRDKFGFNGLVISDAGSCFEMISYGYAKDLYDCAVKSLVAGVDIDLGSDVYQFELENAIRDGKVSEELLDEAVLRVLVKKFDLGLFDEPFKRLPKETIFSDEHLKVAEELALECPVLLENNGILPIAKTKKIAFVGEFSLSKDLLGCWQYSHTHASTHRKAIFPPASMKVDMGLYMYL